MVQISRSQSAAAKTVGKPESQEVIQNLTQLLADTYKLDKIFIARAIVLSTCLSIISLPFWINIV